MFEFKIKNIDWNARTWLFSTPHWNIETPIFMPVWTKATVKWINVDQLDEVKAEIILGNTYHLFLRPGDKLIKEFWWIHKFMNYNKPILTDSWGFQVFSLGKITHPPSSSTPQEYFLYNGQGASLNTNGRLKWNESLVTIKEDWVEFRSYIDWSKHFFSPEKVMDIQSNLWADIIMAFDECAPWNSSYEYAKDAMDRTHRWALRSLEQVNKNNIIRKNEWLHEQALFPIVQWVIYDDLREQSAKFISDLNTSWIAIWWLSVWEPEEDMYRILDILKAELPKEKPRYLMWVWTPKNLIEWIYRWIDMFDCVLPTRLWRHWVAFWTNWNIKIKNNKFKLDKTPLDFECECRVCNNYTKWYIRHLVIEKEMLWSQLISYHNLYFLINLCEKAKIAINENNFNHFRNNFLKNLDK